MQPADPEFEFGRRLGKGCAPTLDQMLTRRRGNAEVWEALYRPLGKETAVRRLCSHCRAHDRR